MKTNKLIIGIALLFLIGCSEKNNNGDVQPNKTPELEKTEYFGCFIEHGNKNSSSLTDTIYYEQRNDTLILNISMVRNCAACLTDSLSIENDSVNIYISDSCLPAANCNCDFEFKYYFTNYGENVFFSIYTNSTWEPVYLLWGKLAYP
ncbi:MAG TPA: hypothetical protein VIN10_10895 [Bacteroidales bacterium]